MSRKYQVKLLDGKIQIERPPDIDKDHHLNGKIQRTDSQIQFVPNSVDLTFDHFFSNFTDEINGLRLSKKNTNEIYGLIENFTKAIIGLCGRFAENTGNADTFSTAQSYVLDHIQSVKSVYRRDKTLKKNPAYVAPIEKAIGLRWKTKISSELDLPDHQFVQTTFQVVPLTMQIEALFLDPEFKLMFFDYNKKKHKCIDGVFQDYCCGKIGRENELFRREDVVIIQFGIDEFETCCGLKSKATVHKLLGIYFQILNMPHSSKLNHIFLAALCPSINFKESGCSDDNVLQELCRELLVLERDGINVDGVNLKVLLFNVSCDNLGANVLFGFAEGFNAEYYCRFCECTKEDAQKLVEENASKRRSINGYEKQVDRLKNDPDLSLKQTKGVKKSCVFNELPYFHVLSNLSIDIMHDICEGAIPYFLAEFFRYCSEHRIVSHQDSIRRIRDYNYGLLNKKNIPSQLRIDRHNLGQSAIQSYTIMVHMPFIYGNKKNELKDVWPIMTSLLTLMHIIFSYTINQAAIEQYKTSAKIHLSGMRDIFEIKLKPKHHNLLHGAEVICQMGPPRLMWMMNYERKHKHFTDEAKKTNNNVNIAKTLAQNHQSYICSQKYCSKENVKCSKSMCPVAQCKDFLIYQEFLEKSTEFDLTNVVATKFLIVNENDYRKGFMIIHDKQVAEIVYIIKCGFDYYLFCHKHDVIDFDYSFNSFKIKKSQMCSQNFFVVNVTQLVIKKSFEKIIFDKTYYLIAENLEMFTIYNQ